jgi:hypothetical protein
MLFKPSTYSSILACANVISERLEEPSEDDGKDDPADPAIHLERQLRRIRRGEQIERLTIRMKKEE